MFKKVYISSTYKDLVQYRDAIRDMFLSKGLQDEYSLISMEGYVAESGKKAIDVCLADVRQADIYILVLAKRYGSIVEGTNVSYTEMEYNEALKVAQQNPLFKIFVFYSNEEIEKEEFAGKPQLDNPQLENFYTIALKNSASFIHPFTTPDNLCKQILLTFNYNYKKPGGIADYKEALLLIDRNDQSYNFSRSVRHNANSFYFTSVYENNPNDFLERLFDLEMGGLYRKCNIELGQFGTLNADKFRDTFIAELSSQWSRDMSTFGFENEDRLFLSVEINSIEINSDLKLQYLQKVLSEFLPSYLTSNGQTTNNRVFFIFYTYLASEEPQNKKFDDLISGLVGSLKMAGCLNAINALNDITKTDTRNWLKVFIKGYSFDQDDVDEMLHVEANPFKTFKMKEVNKLIKTWLNNNLFKN